MWSIGRAGSSCVRIYPSRVFSRAPEVRFAGVAKAFNLLAAALTAATLAACAQSSVVTSKPASLAASQQASPEPGRKASLVTRRVAAATKKHTPFRTNKGAAESRDGSYGLASFYRHESQTASGEKFDPNELTAAHRTLPFGTRLRVTNLATGQSVTVRINDRGPFIPGRVVDVSHSAAETLGITAQGIAKVKLDVVQ